jgi:hypothetical protein
MENETQQKSALEPPTLQAQGSEPAQIAPPAAAPPAASRPVEIGGPAGPEPTRYGDWERRGRCIDF